MGSFVFKWAHPASEVYVTGTFDNWGKSEKLEKVGDIFEKKVTLSNAAEKIYYKFVVDGNWVTDHTAPQEDDASGNLNNVLTPENITKHAPETAGIMSGVTPTSTTAGLAKDAPLEKDKAALNGSSDLPGAFPETPAAVETGDFSVNPLPAADGAVNPIKLAPGEKVPPPSEFTTNTVTSGVHDDPELVAADKAKSESEQTFGVSPLPAFPGAVNPVKVAPGEKIPDPNTLTGNTINAAVRLDKESYENSGAGTFDASPAIQSSGPQSSTANLAAAVPLESTKVPEVVKESQAEAGVSPEASAVPEEVKEKSAVENELLKEVPEAPSTSEGTAGKGTNKSEKGVTAGDAVAAVGGAVAAAGATAAYYASAAASKLPESVQSKLPDSVKPSTDPTPTKEIPATDTPEIVKESVAESGKSPEAAANAEAVSEKKAVEKELLSEVKPENSTGEPAPKTSAAAGAGLAAPASPSPQIESRDISPTTVPGAHTQTQTAPTVTTGVGSATTAPVTPAKASIPATSTPASSSKASETPASQSSATAEKKKKNRTSFFGKLKNKLTHKD